ncbi:MAG: winged helix DNA-binding protein [Atopobiaceae bacterium]|jgi:DNA-binding MarR family transcriptional regulator|nr:winged helix DNA-binding protein [Atopobiaceae bacterium]MCH4120280.1 winged helix DNA-binding protein [Atopobiaceae bacterium]MCI1317815.1 winged helix DNA-binding protein [Atopobiaceae bacterium]MCI1388932.1 winged helix DNA-binding protein [Atopobiaceae bacterium]MCI1431834.1 winged helix DNA-binding protein [Atopobiaceae bacterium]
MPEIGVRDLDVLYQETDRLYYLLARGCGLSESAYWTLYDVDIAGGETTLAAICRAHSLSRQTVSATVKGLERRGLVVLDFAPGSGKSKVVRLTEQGRRFCDERIRPAIEAEQRAFDSLTEHDRAELVRTGRLYAAAVRSELGRLELAATKGARAEKAADGRGIETQEGGGDR